MNLMKKQREKQSPSDIGVYYKMLQHFKQDNTGIPAEENAQSKPHSPNHINVKIENARNENNPSANQLPQQESRGDQVHTPMNYEVNINILNREINHK